MIVPEFKLQPMPMDDAARHLERTPSLNADIGTRSKIGGVPSGQGVPEFPRCPQCGEEMSYYGQLDSLPNVQYLLADAGLALVFVCFDCFEIAARLQTT